MRDLDKPEEAPALGPPVNRPPPPAPKLQHVSGTVFSLEGYFKTLDVNNVDVPDDEPKGSTWI